MAVSVKCLEQGTLSISNGSTLFHSKKMLISQKFACWQYLNATAYAMTQEGLFLICAFQADTSEHRANGAHFTIMWWWSSVYGVGWMIGDFPFSSWTEILHCVPFLGSSTAGSRLGGVIAGVRGTAAGVCLGGERTGCTESEGETHHLPRGNVSVMPYLFVSQISSIFSSWFLCTINRF